MRPKRIKWIIVLVAITLIGLITIQVFWINQAIQQRKYQFKVKVYDAMRQSLLAYDEVLINQKLEAFLNSPSSILAVIKDKNTNNGKKLEQSVTITSKNDSGVNKGSVWMKKTLTSPLGEYFFKNEPARNQISQLYYLPETYDSSKTGTKLLLNQLRKLQANAELSGKIMKALLQKLEQINESNKKNNALDTALLSGIIHEQLLIRGIDLPFEFAIFNKIQEKFNFISGGEKKDFLSSSYNIPLYLTSEYYENFLILSFSNQTLYLIKNMWLLVLLSIILIIILIIVFSYIIITVFRQKKISEIKTDFVNNITHELKTPISTISLACQAMGDKDIASTPAITANYVGMINDENKRLSMLVENILQSALLDKGKYKPRIKKIDINKLIDKVVSSLAIQTQNKNITLKKHLNAKNAVIEADEIMITNSIFNLADNAIKYSKRKNARVDIYSEDNHNKVTIKVKDNGIGISRQNHKKIFDKLYRIPTGNVHNAKGHGLGLSYIKSIIDYHHGEVKVESQLGKGSTFSVILPKKYTE